MSVIRLIDCFFVCKFFESIVFPNMFFEMLKKTNKGKIGIAIVENNSPATAQPPG